jgi:predicted nucleic acid-binding protein
MNTETIYFDTSVPSAYYDAREPKRREDTVNFWNTKISNYKSFVSDITIEEINGFSDVAIRTNMLKLVESFKVLKMNTNVNSLANAYVQNGVFLERDIYDAYHAAFASIHQITYLVSWNFNHLVKAKTRHLLNFVNAIEGYKTIEIICPLEI